MDVTVTGPGPTEPFHSARDRFVTEYSLADPVTVRIRTDPDERTWTAHEDDRHILNISRSAAHSAMARELALHEFSHMYRHEERHPSHTQSTREAIYLAFAGQRIEQHKLTHCYQIANHMKDIYADDVTLTVGSPQKLVNYLEAGLAKALSDQPSADGPAQVPIARGRRLTARADPALTAVNSAFALALLERHELLSADHRIYDLAAAAAADAPGVPLDWFKARFRELSPDPSERTYRQQLVDLTEAYVDGGTRAAD